MQAVPDSDGAAASGGGCSRKSSDDGSALVPANEPAAATEDGGVELDASESDPSPLRRTGTSGGDEPEAGSKPSMVEIPPELAPFKVDGVSEYLIDAFAHGVAATVRY